MNLQNLLGYRETMSGHLRNEINNSLEDSFMSGNSAQFDIPLASSVSSTIAIALSCDGHTFATTHGDHTVKVFVFNSGAVLRVFHGHPRTPWTVKYHPTDPSILASGCLGFEVRIWSIELNCLLNVMRFEYSIISVAFHPVGQYIAVASGSRLEMWDWTKTVANAHKKDQFFSRSVLVPSAKSRVVYHIRNIRAVIFHPSGEFVLAAAPDSPRQPADTLTPCRLYAFRFDYLFDLSMGDGPIELTSLIDILPQIHLYSDGGLDISRDGSKLFTCALLYVPPVPEPKSDNNFIGSLADKLGGNGNNNIIPLSPLSHSDKMNEDGIDQNNIRNSGISRFNGQDYNGGDSESDDSETTNSEDDEANCYHRKELEYRNEETTDEVCADSALTVLNPASYVYRSLSGMYENVIGSNKKSPKKPSEEIIQTKTASDSNSAVTEDSENIAGSIEGIENNINRATAAACISVHPGDSHPITNDVGILPHYSANSSIKPEENKTSLDIIDNLQTLSLSDKNSNDQQQTNYEIQDTIRENSSTVKKDTSGNNQNEVQISYPLWMSPQEIDAFIRNTAAAENKNIISDHDSTKNSGDTNDQYQEGIDWLKEMGNKYCRRSKPLPRRTKHTRIFKHPSIPTKNMNINGKKENQIQSCEQYSRRSDQGVVMPYRSFSHLNTQITTDVHHPLYYQHTNRDELVSDKVSEAWIAPCTRLSNNGKFIYKTSLLARSVVVVRPNNQISTNNENHLAAAPAIGDENKKLSPSSIALAKRSTPSDTPSNSNSCSNQKASHRCRNDSHNSKKERPIHKKYYLTPSFSQDHCYHGKTCGGASLMSNAPQSIRGSDNNDNCSDNQDGFNLHIGQVNTSTPPRAPIFGPSRPALPPGWHIEEQLCVFELNFTADGAYCVPPTLIKSRLLPGMLMRAVTSTKLSSTGRYALIGYGVRSNGEVKDHHERFVACEVISLCGEKDGELPTVNLVIDAEDEVNVAQFHPSAGNGMVYGTKRGKVRTFLKDN